MTSIHGRHEELDKNNDVGNARRELLQYFNTLIFRIPDRQHASESRFRYSKVSSSCHWF